MGKFNVTVLFNLYKKHDGVYLAMERDVIANRIKGVPRTRETLKKYCEQYKIPAKYQQVLAQNTEEVIAKYKTKKADLLDLCWDIIEQYRKQLRSKEKVSETSFLMAWKILKTELGESLYVKASDPKQENLQVQQIQYIIKVDEETKKDEN